VANSYWTVKVATFAYDRIPSDDELAQIRAGTLTAPAQAVLAVGANVRGSGDGNAEFLGAFVLAGSEYEAVAEPGQLYQSPQDSTHVVYLETQYLEPTDAPASPGSTDPVSPGNSGSVPVSSDPFGLGSLTNPLAGGASASSLSAGGILGGGLLGEIVAGVIVAVIVKHYL
jgi:hypothetical protein